MLGWQADLLVKAVARAPHRSASGDPQRCAEKTCGFRGESRRAA